MKKTHSCMVEEHVADICIGVVRRKTFFCIPEAFTSEILENLEIMFSVTKCIFLKTYESSNMGC